MHPKIVRAEFKPGGKQYHYLAAAQIGDTIQAPGNSPATVIGFGRQGYDGKVREAKVIATPEGPVSRAIRHEMAGLQATIPIKRGAPIRYVNQYFTLSQELLNAMNYDTLPAAPEPSQVEKAEALLKRVKADEKRARKAARAKKQAAKDRAKRRDLALHTLGAVAADHLAPSAARVAAAVELLKATS